MAKIVAVAANLSALVLDEFTMNQPIIQHNSLSNLRTGLLRAYPYLGVQGMDPLLKIIVSDIVVS